MKINLIGVPLTYGCGKDGAQYGPSVLRENNMIDLIKNNGHTLYDLGDLVIPPASEEDQFKGHENIKYLDLITEVNTNLAHQVYCSLEGESFPFVIGGDHSLGMGSIAGISKHFNEVAVIWIDAHSDINTHLTSPSGNPHGMPLAASMGVGHPKFTDIYFKGQKVHPKNVYIIGVRDPDAGELALVDDLNLSYYSMKTVREKGLENVLNEVIENIKGSGVDGVHISYDIDVFDKSIVPGTGTPVADGFTLEEGKFTIETLLKENFVTSMDFVELNPLLDDASKTTVKTAVEFLNHTFKCL